MTTSVQPVTGQQPADRHSRSGRAIWRGPIPEQSGLGAAIVALVIVLSWQSPYFFDLQNFSNIGTAIAVTAIMSFPTTIVLISQGLDLSLGAVMAISGIALEKAISGGYSAGVAIAFALAVGLAAGLLNSTLIVIVGINAFIVTIGAQFVYRGLAFAWTGGSGGAGSIGLVQNGTITAIGNAKPLGIPAPVYIMAAVLIVTYVLLRFTRFGANTYAIGGSMTAALRAGIRVNQMRIAIYCMSSLSAAMAGIVLVGIVGAAIPTAGQGIELTVVGGVILGGTGLLGGKGTVSGTLLGVLLLGILNNGLTLLGVGAAWQILSQGAALLLAVLVDELRRKKMERA